MDTATLATTLGTTKGALNQHRRRKSDIILEGTHWTNTTGIVTWTQEGIDLMATMVNTPEAEAYRQERTQGGHSIQLVGDSSLLVTWGDPVDSSLPDPTALGEAIAETRFQADLEDYINAVNHAAATKYEALLDEVTVTLGETLAGTWGLEPNHVTRLIQTQGTV